MKLSLYYFLLWLITCQIFHHIMGLGRCCAGIHSLMMCWYVVVSTVRARDVTNKRISIAFKDHHITFWFVVTHRM